MRRFDIGRRTPPVRIGQSQARGLAAQLLNDSAYTARGAGDYGAKEARFASVPLRLRIDKSVGANTASIKAGALPIGHTHRKAGYPVLTEEVMFGAPAGG
jgi:hypothetical protein